jgi:type I restriction enzyme, S subunit
MTEAWPRVRLGDVLRLVSRPVDVQVDTEYREIGIRSFGNGIFHKEPTAGLLIGDKRVFRIEPGDFVLNIVFAWEGALAIASFHDQGMIGSHRFPTFRPDEARLDVRFLRWFFLTKPGLEMLLRVSPGGAGRNRTLSRDAFLNLEVPLPALETQTTIADRLDAARAHVDEGATVAKTGAEATRRLAQSVIAEAWRAEDTWKKLRFDAVVRLVSGQVDPRLEPYADMPHINGEAIEVGTGRLLTYRTAREDGVISGKYAFQPGAVLYSKIRPYLMKATIVPEAGVCSADVYATEWIDESLMPEFLVYSLLSPRFTAYANRLSGRTRMPKLNQEQLLAYELAVPPRKTQGAIVDRVRIAVRKQATLLKLMEQRTEALDAMMPSALRAFFDPGTATKSVPGLTSNGNTVVAAETVALVKPEPIRGLA